MRTRGLLGLTLVLLAVAGLAPAATAQAPGLALTLTPSHTLIAPGDTLRVAIGATHQGPPLAMDVYLVVLLPDGDSAVAVGAGGFVPGRVSQLAALAPFAAGVTLPTGFAQSLDPVLTYTFTGSEPPGPYQFFLAALRPGALADGRVDPGDLLALATAQVTFGPQALDTVARVQAGPAGLLLTQIGDAGQLSAVAFDAQGGVLDVAIAWASSDPQVVSVDQAGTVRATATSGTALITASAGTMQAEPVHVYVAAPVAGALLVTDSQIVSGPAAVDPAAEPSPGAPYEVVLRGMPSLPLGTILINTGALAVGGRVVDVQPQGGDLRVRLVVVPPQQLFSDFAFKDTVDLTQMPFETPADIAALYDVAQAGNTFVFTPKPPNPTAVSHGTRAGPAVGTQALPPLPPFKECEASAGFGSGLPVPLSLSAPPTFTLDVNAMLVSELTSQGRKVVVTGTPTFTFSSVLEIESAFEAKIECKVTLQRRKVRLPGVAGLFFGGDVEFGVGFEVAGKVTLFSAKVGGTAQLNTTLEAGLVCPAGTGDCALSGNATATTALTPTFETPSLDQARFEPSVTLFAFVTAELGNADIEQLQFKALEAKVGAKLGASYTLEALQIDNLDPDDGRSQYTLAIEGEVGPGIKFGEFLEYVGLDEFVPLQLTFTLPLGESPTGSVTADRASYLPGERVTVQVRLDPASTRFFAGTVYNVNRVVVVRKNGLFSTEALATQSASNGQTEFTLAFDSPGLVNATELFAFVVPRFLPLDPPKLEIGKAVPVASEAAVHSTQLERSAFPSGSIGNYQDVVPNVQVGEVTIEGEISDSGSLLSTRATRTVSGSATDPTALRVGADAVAQVNIGFPFNSTTFAGARIEVTLDQPRAYTLTGQVSQSSGGSPSVTVTLSSTSPVFTIVSVTSPQLIDQQGVLQPGSYRLEALVSLAWPALAIVDLNGHADATLTLAPVP
jgi:hypothetical protein